MQIKPADDDAYVLWSPNGTRLAAYGDHFGKIWDTNNWELLQDNDVVYEGLRGIEWASSSDFYLTWSAYGSNEDDFQLPHVDIWNGH
ncbi:MAG: hypothetical protein IPO22_14835 [Anaerolineales bacterium]|nr:hypothetical protein [Anaerolineales bacterium]